MITNLILEPMIGSFDTERVIATLREFANTYPDLDQTNKFLLFVNADSAERGLSERDATGSIPYSAVVVKVNPTKITVGCMTADSVRAREFVAWIATEFRMRYFDEGRNELTAEAERDPTSLF